MNRIILAIICFAAALAVGLILTYPVFQSYLAEREDLGRKETELAYSQEHFSDLKKIERDLENYRGEIAKIEKALPEYFSLPGFFANMQKLASQGGMILNSITGDKSKSEGNLQTHSYSLSLSGTFLNFKGFLSILENSAKLIEIKSFNFSSPEEEKETKEFKLNIETKSY